MSVAEQLRIVGETEASVIRFPIKQIEPEESDTDLGLVFSQETKLFKDDPDTTSHGRPKAKAAEPLRSYEDYRRICDMFLSRGQVRNYALLTTGIATGLRISDLVGLRFGDFLSVDGDTLTFRESLNLTEKKTGKKTKSVEDEILITPAIKKAIKALATHYYKNGYGSYKGSGRRVSLDDWVFDSEKPRNKKNIKNKKGELIKNPLYGEYVLSEESAHRIMKDAQRELELPINLGSHSMRNTFSSLAYVIAKRNESKSTAALESVQILLRHSSQRDTARYLKLTKRNTAKIRNEISRFLLGESEITHIEV